MIVLRSSKKIEMDRSEVESGEEENRVCHCVRDPYLCKRILAISRVDW